MQFRIKVENEAEIQGGVADTKYENLRIAFGNGTITSTSNEAFCIRSNGTNFTYNVSGSSYSPLTGEYHVSDWNTITLVTHVNADGTDTTDVYVNGQLLLQNAQNKVDFSVIDKMCFAADTAKYAKYSIDDLVIWAGDYDDAPTEEEKPTDPDDAVRTVLEVPAPTILPVRILLAVPVVRTAVADKIRMPRTSPGPTVDRVHLRSSPLRAAVRRRPVMPGNLRCGVW